MKLTSVSIPRSSKCLPHASTPRMIHEELISENGTLSRKQSFASIAQNRQDYDDNSNIIFNNPHDNNDEPIFQHEEQHELSDDFDSFIFNTSSEDKLNPKVEEVVNKIHDWIQNEDKYKVYQKEDENDREDFFRWLSDEERNKITEDILKCFDIEGGGYEILTDVEVEQRYFAKNLDAIPLHLLLVHSTKDLLESLENVVRVPSAGEELYTIEDENFGSKFDVDVNYVETSPRVEIFRSPSYESVSSLDLTQSSYANSSFGYQTECDFDDLINGVSEIEISHEEEPSIEDFLCEDEDINVEFPESFFDKL
uniref:Uncharacterized protein n=1 Tax=Strongyloides venezuelensis TaxID=75913 RepID=A0A0K0F090_STRVS